jgi:hypothetical protein
MVSSLNREAAAVATRPAARSPATFGAGHSGFGMNDADSFHPPPSRSNVDAIARAD